METNALTKKITAMFRPTAALIAYATETNSHDASYHLEVREIDDEGRFSEGRPVTHEFMNELVKGYSERFSATPHGRVPENMLFCDTRKGSERYVWYNPPRRRMMFFSERLGIECTEYNIPGVIYDAGEHGMRIYAYVDENPIDESVLYAAPFFNVSGANVCLGSAKIEKPSDLTYYNLLDYWERKFWLTEFSHLGSYGNPTRSNLVTVTKAAASAPFDITELQPINKLKLKDILT